MRFFIVSFLVLAGCSAPPEARGTIVSFNGDLVTIRGGLNQVAGRAGFVPTQGMIDQASEACRSDAVPQGTEIAENQPTGTINYIFLCR